MFESFQRSFRLLKESWNVLHKDREILLFPIMGMVTTLLLFSPLVSILYLTYIEYINIFEFVESYHGMFIVFLSVAVLVVGTVFSGMFFKAGMMTCAHMRLNGRDPTVMDGIRYARENVLKIFKWSLLSLGTEIGLNTLRSYAGRYGGIPGSAAAYGVRVAWEFVTYLVFPIIIFENLSLVDSLKKSGKLLRNTWGENIIGRLSLGLVIIVGMLIFLAIIILLSYVIASLVPDTTGFIIWIVVMTPIVTSIFIFLLFIDALEVIFKTALYNYAVTGKIPSSFSHDVIAGAFKIKGGNKINNKLGNKKSSGLKPKYVGSMRRF